MPLPAWLVSALGGCSRRRQPVVEETPFWEEEKPSKPEDTAQEEPDPPPGYEQAVHLKDEGKEKFARGETNEAMDLWVHALDALCSPQRSSGSFAEDPVETRPSPADDEDLLDDPQVKELRVGLLLNLALGHKKLKQWRHSVSYCDEALVDEPANVKALYRKADSLGELCEWKEAEEAAAKLEETGEEGRKLSAQKREEWRRRRKAADGRQKKMWSAALAESMTSKPAPSAEDKEKDKENEKPKPKEPPKKEVLERWVPPKVASMSVFDLRHKAIEWDEKQDFDDVNWRHGLGRKEATFYQPLALPLTLLAGVVLGELDLSAEFVVHILLDGNVAPFGQPHDWSAFLRRCPRIRSLTVVYIDIGYIGEVPKDNPASMPYGTLMRPTEEGRVGDRVARAARFMGTYKEFRDHCQDLPGLVVPSLALWADVPLYGFNDDDFGVRMEAYELLASLSVPSVFTQGGEVTDPFGPPATQKPDDQAVQCMAVLKLGLAARMVGPWSWNRFVVPLDRGDYGILAAHALIAVARPSAKSGATVSASGAAAKRVNKQSSVSAATMALVSSVKERLKARGINLTQYELPKVMDAQSTQLRKEQWAAFERKLKEEGRPTGANCSPAERNQQAMEFYQFCGLGGGA